MRSLRFLSLWYFRLLYLVLFVLTWSDSSVGTVFPKCFFWYTEISSAFLMFPQTYPSLTLPNLSNSFTTFLSSQRLTYSLKFNYYIFIQAFSHLKFKAEYLAQIIQIVSGFYCPLWSIWSSFPSTNYRFYSGCKRFRNTPWMALVIWSWTHGFLWLRYLQHSSPGSHLF